MTILTVFTMTFVINSVNAQNSKKEIKEEIKKEVKISNENGEKVMTIVTTTNGKTTKETYKGADAEAKIKELESEMEKESSTTKTVKTMPDGKKEVRVEKRVIKKEEIKKD